MAHANACYRPAAFNGDFTMHRHRIFRCSAARLTFCCHFLRDEMELVRLAPSSGVRHAVSCWLSRRLDGSCVVVLTARPPVWLLYVGVSSPVHLVYLQSCSSYAWNITDTFPLTMASFHLGSVEHQRSIHSRSSRPTNIHGAYLPSPSFV